jgi:hypothetical protein
MTTMSREWNSFLHQRGARQHRVGAIDAEHGDGRAAHRSQASQAWPVPLEMFRPQLLSWLEQPHDPRGLRIHAGEIGALVAIAAEAGERKVGCLGLAAVLAGR